MGFSREFTIRKSTEEVVDYAIQFLPKDPTATTYVLASGLVTALDDGTNEDATSLVVETSNTQVGEDKLMFRLKAGTSGRGYVIKAQATTNNNQILSCWGTLVVNDPV